MTDTRVSIATDVVCSGCGQEITCTRDGQGWYSECGGEGEGGCEVWCDGSGLLADAAEADHRLAVSLMPTA